MDLFSLYILFVIPLFCPVVDVIKLFLEVVVAQLVERSLSIPEVRGSNPVIGKNLFIH